MNQTITFELTRTEIGQALDALESRRDAYQRTAAVLRGQLPDDAFLIEEVTDAEEAEDIAGMYAAIIEKIVAQKNARS